MSAIAAWWFQQTLAQLARNAVVAAASAVLPIGDTFTDADSTALTSHVPTGANPGASWTSIVGTVPIVRNNEAYDATHTALQKVAVLNASAAYGTNDYTVAGVMRFASDPGGSSTNHVMGRVGASRSGYGFGYNHDSARWELMKYGAASDGTGDTLLGSSAATFASVTGTSPTFALVMSGTNISGKVAGATVVAPVSDATYTTGKGGVSLMDSTTNNSNFGFFVDTLTFVSP